MRRRLLGELPALMATFPGFRPWDIDRYRPAELAELRAYAANRRSIPINQAPIYRR